MTKSPHRPRKAFHGRARLRPGFSLLLLAWIVVLVGGIQMSAANVLEETRAALQTWMDTRQKISQAKTTWDADKELLGVTIDLYDRELKSVEDKMSNLSTNSVQVDKERAEAEASMKASEEALDRARQFAAGFEGQLLQLVPRLPAPLQDILKPFLDKMPKDSKNSDMPVTARIQAVVGILNEIDKFNNAVTIFPEKRQNANGEEVAVEAVYIGLGAAYFVNDSNDLAGTGVPGATGWEWTVQPAVADHVREVIRIYKNERTARFVSLPAVIR